jgi:hypothetical protein
VRFGHEETRPFLFVQQLEFVGGEKVFDKSWFPSCAQRFFFLLVLFESACQPTSDIRINTLVSEEE